MSRRLALVMWFAVATATALAVWWVLTVIDRAFPRNLWVLTDGQ